MAERAVINASPLIFFARSQHLKLLRAFAKEVWVPAAVAEEILRRGERDCTASAIRDTRWLVIKRLPEVPPPIREWRLGDGESEVLALAMAHGLEAIIDDLAARKCASSLAIPVRGTLGIVLLAKRRGLIPEARPVIETMIQSGLYLSPKVLNRALRRVDE